jgi:DNA-binding MarR family transcriptional regulator
MSQTHSPFNDAQKREKWVAFIHSLNPDIDARAIRLMDELRRVSHALHEVGESSVMAASLSYAKYRLLMGLMFCEEIEGRWEMNPSEISERQGTSRNTISALIRDLEEEGLIERHLDRNDRRKFNIRLSEAGRQRVRTHVGRHLRTISECFSELSAEEQETLSRLLAKLSASATSRENQLARSE